MADHGEVFTAEREVNAMLDLVYDESVRIESRFLEPACGDGNFLVAILRRKLATVRRQHRASRTDYEFHVLIAVSSLYGIELLGDNAAACRERLAGVVREEYYAECRNADEVLAEGFLRSVSFVLECNVVCGDALTYTTAEGRPIVFSEWVPIADTMSFGRNDFQFDFLVHQSHQYSLFDEQGEPQGFDEPVRSFAPVHYLNLCHESYT